MKTGFLLLIDGKAIEAAVCYLFEQLERCDRCVHTEW